jgi:hypothetical protein
MTDPIQRVAQQPLIEVTATLRLTEPELRFLALLASYRVESVVVALADEVNNEFKNHAKAIESLIEMARAEVRPVLRRTDAARDAFLADI